MQIANTSGGPIDLSEYEVESAPYFYEFSRGTVLQAGEALTLVVEQDPSMDTQFVKGWGFDQALFADSKDVVTLRNPLGAPVVCDRLGRRPLPARLAPVRLTSAGEMRRTRFHALAGVLLALLILAPTAEARRGPCIPGIKRPTCYVWTAKVMAVADGDTVNVRVRQNGRWSERRDVRMTGVQAMELTSYSRVGRGRRGACHARAAAERLERLLKGPRNKRRKIRLAARQRDSMTRGPRGRLRRAIAFRQDGRWHDAGAVLMREGHGLWDPNRKEWAWNKRYSKLAQLASLAGRRIWNTGACRTGPRQSSAADREGQVGRQGL